MQAKKKKLPQNRLWMNPLTFLFTHTSMTWVIYTREMNVSNFLVTWLQPLIHCMLDTPCVHRRINHDLRQRRNDRERELLYKSHLLMITRSARELRCIEFPTHPCTISCIYPGSYEINYRPSNLIFGSFVRSVNYWNILFTMKHLTYKFHSLKSWMLDRTRSLTYSSYVM